MNRSKFDEHVTKYFRNEACGLSKDAGSANSKVMTNSTKYKPRASTVEVLNSYWQSIVQPITGYESYASFRLDVNKELARTFGLSHKI